MSQFTIAEFEPILDLMEDKQLRQQVLDIYEEVYAKSEFQHPEDVPMVHEDHSKWNTNLIHHEATCTLAALAVARCVDEAYGTKLNKDYIIAGDLLHDGSKPLEYWKNEKDAGHTRMMDWLGHSMVAANVAYDHGLPKEVVHIIISHTRFFDVPTATLEALLVYYTDLLDGEVRRNLVGLPVKAKKTAM